MGRSIVAGGQFLNSWNWKPQMAGSVGYGHIQEPGSGSYGLGRCGFDRHEFARIENSLKPKSSAGVGRSGARMDRTRQPRIREGRESPGLGQSLSGCQNMLRGRPMGLTMER